MDSIVKKHLDTIYHGDTLDLMYKLPEECVDTIVTDSPYGMNYKSHRREEKPNKWGVVEREQFDHIENDSGEDFEDLIRKYIHQCSRILKDNSAAYFFCSWHKVGFFQAELEKYFTLKNLIVWNKNNHTTGDLYGSYAPKHELIWFCHKGRHILNSPRIPDVINEDKVHNIIHPTQKPTKLLQTLIAKSTKEGDIVFDGFMGSGATAVAALNENRHFIGAELDDGYYKIAMEQVEGARNTFFDLFG
jgi:site-specific DNA-methyltransferase (adenine-specific)